MNTLSDVGKELLKSLNKDDNEYHPLEKYIYAIDYNLDRADILLSIGERIGIYVPEGRDIHQVLFYKLKEYLEKETDKRMTEKIMNMSADEYNEYLIKKHPSNKNLDRNAFYPVYSDRLYQSI